MTNGWTVLVKDGGSRAPHTYVPHVTAKKKMDRNGVAQIAPSSSPSADVPKLANPDTTVNLIKNNIVSSEYDLAGGGGVVVAGGATFVPLAVFLTETTLCLLDGNPPPAARKNRTENATVYNEYTNPRPVTSRTFATYTCKCR